MKRISFFAIAFLSLAGWVRAQEKTISLDDIWLNGTFNAKGVSGFQPSTDGETYTRLEYDRSNNRNFIVKYNYKTGNVVDTIYRSDMVNASNTAAGTSLIESYSFSKNGKYLIYACHSEYIYRHSFRALYFVVDLKLGKPFPVSSDKVRYATLSPDGSMVAYVKDNDLYVKPIMDLNATPITSDGEEDKIINGAVDWVYEEEFSMSNGFSWSEDGEKIAYYKFDESQVKEFSMPIYGSLYPQNDNFKYPKAGEANSVVRIFVYDVKKGNNKEIETGYQNDQYLPRMGWTAENDKMYFIKLNRLQNKMELHIADANTGKTNVIYTEENKYYVDINDNITWLPNKKELIFSSEKSGYHHIYIMNTDGKNERALTKGNFDIDQFLGYDSKNNLIYFTSAEEGPIARHLYSVDLKGKKTKISKADGWNSVYFNSTFTYFMNSRSTANEPPVYTLHDAKGNLIKELENNSALKTKMRDYNFGKFEFSTINTASGNRLNYWMLRPNNFDPKKKYPVLMYVYGGPGSQTVMDRWGGANSIWYQMLAQQGYIIISVDNRGTGFRGEEFKKMTYLQLGKIETQDQIDAAKWFAKLEYVDANRIGIWGWSYGGYMSSLCLAKGNDIFKMAIAVAPVTNWRYYDNIYTERYMRTPQVNGENYDANSPISHVEKIKGKYLIIHGTADDNVHFQNAVEMVNKMIEKGVKFDSEFYPNKNHGIGGGKTRYHLFDRMTSFILENL